MLKFRPTEFSEVVPSLIQTTPRAQPGIREGNQPEGEKSPFGLFGDGPIDPLKLEALAVPDATLASGASTVHSPWAPSSLIALMSCWCKITRVPALRWRSFLRAVVLAHGWSCPAPWH